MGWFDILWLYLCPLLSIRCRQNYQLAETKPFDMFENKIRFDILNQVLNFPVFPVNMMLQRKGKAINKIYMLSRGVPRRIGETI